METRILVVDDEDTIRGVIAQVLTEEGFEVVTASSGEEALERFRNGPFPLVLTDIYMGKMNGLDLAKEIRLLDSDAMVVLMTSNASLDTATQALRTGVYDYLMKPFDNLDQITAVVNRAIDRVAAARENRALMDDLQRKAREMEELNARLERQANRDGLTGLYNHRFFRDLLDKELARAKRHRREFSLLFIDIDHFKYYNDTHGHLAGDEVLRTLAKLLLQRCRRSTTLARYGGEEFVLLVPETGRAGAKTFAEDLRRLVEEHPFPGGQTQPLGKVTLSLGVATYPEAGDDSNTLIDHADKALYESKHAGRNTVTVWEPTGTR